MKHSIYNYTHCTFNEILTACQKKWNPTHIHRPNVLLYEMEIKDTRIFYIYIAFHPHSALFISSFVHCLSSLGGFIAQIHSYCHSPSSGFFFRLSFSEISFPGAIAISQCVSHTLFPFIAFVFHPCGLRAHKIHELLRSPDKWSTEQYE